MRDAVRAAICASLVLAFPLTGSAQPASVGVDEPCMAPFMPSGYPRMNRLVPTEAAPPVRARIRGVVARSLVWQPGETLKVCFRSGTRLARARVVQFASEWARYANLVLDFGDPSDPRMCQGDNHESIKIDFIKSGPKSGFWSAIGTASRKTDHSMNLASLGEDELPRNRANQQMSEAEARRLVLHEFGHVLGLFHEHQSPKSGCAAEYYEEAVFAFGALRGWAPERTIQNFREIANTAEFNATEVDRKSIMHYSLPPWLFKAGEKSPCWVPANFEVSQGDKQFVAKIYPKTAGPQVATAPTGSVTRGVSVRSASKPGDKLVEEYKSLLREGGLNSAKVESLTNEFKASLSGR
jgi:hypothetical protein